MTEEQDKTAAQSESAGREPQGSTSRGKDGHSDSGKDSGGRKDEKRAAGGASRGKDEGDGKKGPDTPAGAGTSESPVPGAGEPEGKGGGEKAGEGKPAAARKSKRGVRVVSAGVAHIRASFNNTMIAIADMEGHVVAWSSSGRAGFKGSRKSTAFAATVVGQDVARQASARGMREVEVRIQGAGAGRESAIRAIQAAGLNISVIKDVTPVPHNGCRPRKRRRV